MHGGEDTTRIWRPPMSVTGTHWDKVAPAGAREPCPFLVLREAPLPKASSKRASEKKSRPTGSAQNETLLRNVLWRLDRLERQVRTLSELVRDHAEDADRLVKIVAEDREVLRRELLQEHRQKMRVRKRVRVGATLRLPR